MNIKATHNKNKTYQHMTLKEFADKYGLKQGTLYMLIKESEKGQINTGIYSIECTHEKQVRLNSGSWYCHDCDRDIGR